jgi:hypothetical protein
VPARRRSARGAAGARGVRDDRFRGAAHDRRREALQVHERRQRPQPRRASEEQVQGRGRDADRYRVPRSEERRRSRRGGDRGDIRFSLRRERRSEGALGSSQRAHPAWDGHRGDLRSGARALRGKAGAKKERKDESSAIETRRGCAGGRSVRLGGDAARGGGARRRAVHVRELGRSAMQRTVEPRIRSCRRAGARRQERSRRAAIAMSRAQPSRGAGGVGSRLHRSQDSRAPLYPPRQGACPERPRRETHPTPPSRAEGSS